MASVLGSSERGPAQTLGSRDSITPSPSEPSRTLSPVRRATRLWLPLEEVLGESRFLWPDANLSTSGGRVWASGAQNYRTGRRSGQLPATRQETVGSVLPNNLMSHGECSRLIRGPDGGSCRVGCWVWGPPLHEHRDLALVAHPMEATEDNARPTSTPTFVHSHSISLKLYERL